ncbi:hypothetical protein NHG32_02445 [Aerococcaceae bacterium NML191219]|nr:hypothetical protein [Aerococcaceae bacterium NML191219]
MCKELLRYAVIFLGSFILACGVIYVQNATTPVPFMHETIKQAKGKSVLVKTEKLGDDVKPLIVRHWARYTETGSVEYWVELID